MDETSEQQQIYVGDSQSTMLPPPPPPVITATTTSLPPCHEMTAIDGQEHNERQTACDEFDGSDLLVVPPSPTTGALGPVPPPSGTRRPRRVGKTQIPLPPRSPAPNSGSGRAESMAQHSKDDEQEGIGNGRYQHSRAESFLADLCSTNESRRLDTLSSGIESAADSSGMITEISHSVKGLVADDAKNVVVESAEDSCDRPISINQRGGRSQPGSTSPEQTLTP